MYSTQATFQEEWVTETLLSGTLKNIQWSIHPTPGRRPTLTAVSMNQLGRTERHELHLQASPAGALGRHVDILQTLINSTPGDMDAKWVPSARANLPSGVQSLVRATEPPAYAVALRLWNQDPTGINSGTLRPFSNWVLTTQATHATLQPSIPGTLPTATLTSAQTGDIANSPLQWVSHTVKMDENLQQKLNTLGSVELDYSTATYTYTLDRKDIKYVDYIVPVDDL